MEIFRDKASFRNSRNNIPLSKRIGFVPTMGALHEGHASLARKAVAENDITIASIFVNPTQFGPNEDLDAYPRTLEKDCEMLESIGVDMVFAPNRNDIYKDTPAQIIFSIRDLDKKLCGASRDGHFNGVVQVVSILFHIVQPGRAYFGEKDYQQLMIIRHMVEELHFPVEIRPCAIIREADGLAMSSRNVYLSPEERKQSLFLSKTLSTLKSRIGEFERVSDMRAFVNQEIQKYPLATLDYFEVYRGEDLGDLDKMLTSDKPHAFLAVFYEKTRLIDNMPLY